MNPLKDLFLFLSRQTILQNLLSTSGPCKIISKRFISGETLDDGVNASRELNQRGISVSLDHLGESIFNEEEAKITSAEETLEEEPKRPDTEPKTIDQVLWKEVEQ